MRRVWTRFWCLETTFSSSRTCPVDICIRDTFSSSSSFTDRWESWDWPISARNFWEASDLPTQVRKEFGSLIVALSRYRTSTTRPAIQARYIERSANFLKLLYRSGKRAFPISFTRQNEEDCLVCDHGPTILDWDPEGFFESPTFKHERISGWCEFPEKK